MDHQGSPGFSYFVVSFSIFPTGLLALRVYESLLIYKVFTGLNILVLSFIIASGFIKETCTTGSSWNRATTIGCSWIW